MDGEVGDARCRFIIYPVSSQELIDHVDEYTVTTTLSFYHAMLCSNLLNRSQTLLVHMTTILAVIPDSLEGVTAPAFGLLRQAWSSLPSWPVQTPLVHMISVFTIPESPDGVVAPAFGLLRHALPFLPSWPAAVSLLGLVWLLVVRRWHPPPRLRGFQQSLFCLMYQKTVLCDAAHCPRSR